MSKGSKRRVQCVVDEVMDENWKRAFRRTEKNRKTMRNERKKNERS